MCACVCVCVCRWVWLRMCMCGFGVLLGAGQQTKGRKHTTKETTCTHTHRHRQTTKNRIRVSRTKTHTKTYAARGSAYLSLPSFLRLLVLSTTTTPLHALAKSCCTWPAAILPYSVRSFFMFYLFPCFCCCSLLFAPPPLPDKPDFTISYVVIYIYLCPSACRCLAEWLIFPLVFLFPPYFSVFCLSFP